VPLGKSIPGETPLDDLSGLKVKDIATRAQLNAVEAENIRQAAVKYFAGRLSRRSARFDFSWLLKLHREMFGDVWAWAGRPRKCNLNLGVPWPHVETRLYILLQNLQFWNDQTKDLLEQAALLHHEAVAIHPFMNGNGRWARMLSNIWLKLHKQPITVWPEAGVAKMNVVRKEYLTALRQADEGDFAGLLELHRKYSASK
jgi:Fic-DOC domain mobile mystery protein B